MITKTQARRLRSIGRFASLARNEIELANALGISPRSAVNVIAAISRLVELVPAPKPGRPKKFTNEHAQP